ncbi:malonyl-ACP O-methyltransferase BioC [Alteribacter populi]|uniref:malonyl-ACP O-methyltransferase BioC n=1 Tax=Alteribacter populi TaxID=2011011 RepID=UPI000BBAFCEB|nr:malonyl-ACP O-methyltransferase BioC [Alteribacter populi]
MELHKSQVLSQFNRSVQSYDDHAIIQRKMAERLLRDLETDEPIRILEVGCGTGILTKILQDRFPKAAITAIDIAEQMVEASKARVNVSSQVTFLVGDAERIEWSTHEPYDLIVSNAVFQWFKMPNHTIANLKRALKPNGWIAASTFGPATFQELHRIFEEVKQEMGLTDGRHTLPMQEEKAWQAVLIGVGLKEVSTEQTIERLTYGNCQQFLKSVKAVGANYSENHYSLGTSRALLKEVMRRYDLAHRAGDGVYTTYEVIEIRGKGGRDDRG